MTIGLFLSKLVSNLYHTLPCEINVQQPNYLYGTNVYKTLLHLAITFDQETVSMAGFFTQQHPFVLISKQDYSYIPVVQ